MAKNIQVIPLLLLAAVLPAAEELSSPGGLVAVSVELVAGQPIWHISHRQRPIIAKGRLGLQLPAPAADAWTLTGVERSAGDTAWKPVWGARSLIHDRYREMTLRLTEAAAPGREVQVILRAYDEGVACRYRVPAQPGMDQVTIGKRLTEFTFTGNHTIHQCRDYQYGTVRIDGMKRSEGAVTVDCGNGTFAALTDADRPGFPMTFWINRKGMPNTILGQLHAPAAGPLPFTTAWEVLLLGDGPTGLHRNRHLVETLSPPCAIADTSWIRPGQAICQVRNARMVTSELKPVLDFASANGIEYLEIDHSWCGAETRWTPEQIDFFAKNHGPFWKDKPDWRNNVGGCLTAPAKGWVPFRPQANTGGNFVDLDLPALAAYGNSLKPKVGICVYVRGAVLKEFGGEHALADVFKVYESWGLAGIKPGFVPPATQANESAIAYMVKKAAEHKLIVCIHDAYFPSGLSRTYPNLVNIEGVAGEEAEPSIEPAIKSLHDVMLPFTRGLMGPLDYTPEFYKKSKTHCHQVAMVGIYDGRPSLRGGMKAWSPGGVGGSELEFIRRYPGLADDERTFTDLGKWVTVARRAGDSWFVASMSGPAAAATALKLDFLEPGRRYRASIHQDTPGEKKATAVTREVDAGTVLAIAMEADGGHLMIIDPLP